MHNMVYVQIDYCSTSMKYGTQNNSKTLSNSKVKMFTNLLCLL